MMFLKDNKEVIRHDQSRPVLIENNSDNKKASNDLANEGYHSNVTF